MKKQPAEAQTGRRVCLLLLMILVAAVVSITIGILAARSAAWAAGLGAAVAVLALIYPVLVNVWKKTS